MSNIAHRLVFILESMENIGGKRENTDYKHFLLFFFVF